MEKRMREVPEDQQHLSGLLLRGLELSGRVNMRKASRQEQPEQKQQCDYVGCPGGGARITERRVDGMEKEK